MKTAAAYTSISIKSSHSTTYHWQEGPELEGFIHQAQSKCI